jgi:hypothetical protein
MGQQKHAPVSPKVRDAEREVLLWRANLGDTTVKPSVRGFRVSDLLPWKRREVTLPRESDG